MPKLSPLAQAWLETLPEDRLGAAHQLIDTIQKNIPKGYELSLQSGMLTWVVPLKTFPAGYHCTPNTPLPLLSIASQKNALTLYHMGIYAEPSLLTWFQLAWPTHTRQKLDMGKSCIRLKKIDDIPFALLGELMQRLSPLQWVALYTRTFVK
jgi:hypothetical protein